MERRTSLHAAHPQNAGPDIGLLPHRRRQHRIALLLLAVGAALAVAFSLVLPQTALAAPAVEYSNPLVEQRADAQITRHTDGYYYFTATVPEYDRIILRRATTVQGLSTAAETVIWTKHSSGVMGAHIWAPEIHFIDGKWYVYFAAGASNDIWAIRMYVLEGTGANPLTATWTEKGQITTPWNSFALDASTFVADGQRYLTWAQSEPGASSSLYISKLANPWTLTGTTTRISTPTYDWERRGIAVNEGPTVLQRNGRLFLTYSASATDANYCLGMLTATAGSDLLDAASWTKSPNPVFASNANTGQWGPGHNSFTTSEDGSSDLLVYHDRSYQNITGDPLNDPNRRTRVQKFYWNADGTPNFGVPVADGSTPVRLASYNVPGSYLRHWEYRAKLEPNVANLADSQFRIVPGLVGTGTVSLESTNFPGYYLRHKNFEVWVQKNDGSTTFKNDASFTRRAGLAAPGDSRALSLESLNYPGRYVRHTGGLIYLQAPGTDADRADATFVTE